MLGVILLLLLGSGCATERGAVSRRLTSGQGVSLGLSPVAEQVTPREAWRLAEAYASTRPDCEVLLGRGDSMLPFYRDNTVLVVAHLAMSELRAGMTVIFLGRSGWPVAHVLVENSAKGWRTRGVGNREEDLTTVRYGNYIGTVVKAYAPAITPTMSDPAIASSRVAMADVAPH